MNTFKPIKGAYTRKFRPYSYAKNDGVAKDAVSGYLIRNGHTILSTEEDYSFDIKSEKNGNTYYSEVEMKRQWFGDWLPSWKEIRIPYRKFKLLNKFKEMNEKDAFFNFYVIRGDMEYAWRIKDYQFTPETVQEIYLSNARRYEYFFHIPYQEAELVQLKEDK
jgi:hypothetical protein|tara:strand:+ start:1426 stop:1914 length:489 start_codon:yes stop_codon:yes gene_type:complete